MELPAVNLKAIVLVHWLLTTWGCLTFSDSYAFANFTVLALGVWAIAQPDSLDAIIMFLVGLAITILLDIIYISIFYPRGHTLSDTEHFGTGMAIFSLLLKPLSCLFAYHMYRERGGEFILNVPLAPCRNGAHTRPLTPRRTLPWHTPMQTWKASQQLGPSELPSHLMSPET
ncbi:type-1 angiotensin II receptor-associated protein isoform X1 [Gracilinanus agilis]|uniref:type-1 angiotensin II receptor-associated protein isoform X1 n=1 Tax=Gracilinanus agilis TaxID=191870 RepID=UPI001CFF1270|nr:type-1 angiotensin II receptor-associated protein isoform X1 [Gracilinanus agilis]